MTLDEWKKLVEDTIPLVPPYAAQFKVDWMDNQASTFLGTGQYEQLWVQFHNLWDQLPDRPAIRTGPFFAICDICSEYGGWKNE